MCVCVCVCVVSKSRVFAVKVKQSAIFVYLIYCTFPKAILRSAQGSLRDYVNDIHEGVQIVGIQQNGLYASDE